MSLHAKNHVSGSKTGNFEVFELLNEVKKIILSQDEKSQFKEVNTERFYACI